MQTRLAPEYQNTADGQLAGAILRQCVHCGFCTATCPTYQLLGDERDGPRGRIYLIKQVLEGMAPTRQTQLHLDRCLTCRSCETTCPSGVEYGHLLDIGRRLVDAKVVRSRAAQIGRWALKTGLSSPWFAPAMKLGQALRPWLPRALQDKVPAPQTVGVWPVRAQTRQVLLLAGCVQPAMAPNINHATARVLDALGIQTRTMPAARCCGALKFHLNDQAGGLAQMRANIDAWWPALAQGATQPQVEAIVMNASGCGVTVKEYGHLLRNDPHYAAKAERISALTKDLSAYLPELSARLQGRVRPLAQRIVFHPPCTLQHGQRGPDGVVQHLGLLGFDIQVTGCEAHWCCGSAGTYSITQPKLAQRLRDRKLGHLHATFGAAGPDVIVSANIGCQTHLQSGTARPVRHWVELLDAALMDAPKSVGQSAPLP